MAWQPLATVSASTATAVTKRAGERTGSSASIRASLYGARLRRTDANGCC